jgi:hypothetical protein
MRTVFRNDPMHNVPVTRHALTVQGLQRGLAMHMVLPRIHHASNQSFKGMDLGLAARDTGLRYGSLLDMHNRFARRFYCPIYSFLIIYSIILSIKSV